MIGEIAATYGKWPHEFDELPNDQKHRLMALYEVRCHRRVERIEAQNEAIEKANAEARAKQAARKSWPKTARRK